MRLLLAVLCVLPGTSWAHLDATGLGPVYDGVAHVLRSPEDLLPVLAMAMLAGLNGAQVGRQTLFALTLAWLAGGIAGFWIGTPLLPMSATIASLLVVGALVALDRRLSSTVVASIATALGMLHGWLNGAGIAEAGREALALAGIGGTVFVLVALGAALVVSLKEGWPRIAVRVAGSWVAAVGLLMLGWSLRASVVLWCAATLLFAPAGPALAQAQSDPPWRVLILNDAHPTLPAFVELERAIRAGLTAPGKHPVNVFAESLDMLRYPESLFEDELVALFAKKYADRPLDAVIATGIAALDFAEEHEGKLWPGARILFMGVPPEVLEKRRLGPNTTGMPRELDLGGVAELALRMRPSTRRLVVISGSGDLDRRLAQVARTQLEPRAARLAIEYWDGASRAEFLQRIARLGRDDAVLYLTISRDAQGRVFSPVELVRPLAAASPAPIYGPFETYVGQGIVAGTVYSFASRGRRMGELVHEALMARPGPPPPLVPPDQPECMADASQLERLGLSVDDLPAGCDIRFVPRSLWREHRWQVLGALFVIAAQAALLFALVLNRRRLRRARNEARDELGRRTQAESMTARLRQRLTRFSRERSLGAMATAIAHEINQPLIAIQNYAQAAKRRLEGNVDDRSKLMELFAKIEGQAERAGAITQRVRSLVSSSNLQREPVAVLPLLDEVVRIMRPEAESRGCDISREPAEGLPDVLADALQVQLVLVNLLRNAVHYDTRISIDVRPLDGGEVQVSVTDRGPGVAADRVSELFEPLSSNTTSGMGIGLSVSREIVEAHGGRLWYEANPAGGAIFRFTLQTVGS